MYMYIYTHVYVCTYIYIYMYIRVYVYLVVANYGSYGLLLHALSILLHPPTFRHVFCTLIGLGSSGFMCCLLF